VPRLRYRRRSWIWLVCRPGGPAAECPVPGSVDGAGTKGENMEGTQDQATTPPACPGERFKGGQAPG